MTRFAQSNTPKYSGQKSKAVLIEHLQKHLSFENLKALVFNLLSLTSLPLDKKICNITSPQLVPFDAPDFIYTSLYHIGSGSVFIWPCLTLSHLAHLILMVVSALVSHLWTPSTARFLSTLRSFRRLYCVFYVRKHAKKYVWMSEHMCCRWHVPSNPSYSHAGARGRACPQGLGRVCPQVFCCLRRLFSFDPVMQRCFWLRRGLYSWWRKEMI